MKPAWWTLRGAELGEAAWSRAMDLQQRQGVERRSIGDAALVLYFGNGRHSTSGRVSDPGDIVADMGLGQAFQPSQNIIQMVTDTIVGHTIRNRVRPFFLTEQGKLEDQENAKGMMQATEGIFHENGIYGDLGLWVAQSGYLWDGGLLKVIPDYERNWVSFQRVYPWEWLIPEREGALGEPWQGFHVYPMDRHELLSAYGDDAAHRKAIEEAEPVPREFVGGDESGGEVSDMVLVVEGYHRATTYVDVDDPKCWGIVEGKFDPNADPGHDGKRVVMIADHVLAEEPWPLDDLPVAEFFPARDPSDYWSRGVAETLAGAQMRIDEYQTRIAEILHRHAVPRLLMWKAAKVKKAAFNNDVGSYTETQVPPGQAAMYLQPNAVPGDLIAELQKTVDWAFAQYGLNAMSLYGEKPTGLDHAPGMEHMFEEQSLRHTQKFRAWETFHIKLARLTVEMCRLLALRDPQFSVMWGDSKSLQKLRWKDFELKRKAFTTTIWAANLLPQTPGMKQKRLNDLVAQKIITPELARTALAEEYPDVGALVGDEAAAERAIRTMLDDVVKKGVTVETMPDPYVNVELGKRMTVDRINALRADRTDQKFIDRAVRFWEALHEYELRGVAETANAQQGIVPGVTPPPIPNDPNMAAPQGVPLQ